MASLEEEPLYCSCRMPYDDTLFMIQCDICNEWYHGKCVGIQEYQAGDVDEFHCTQCQKVHGPSTLKQKRNCHRNDCFEDDNSTVNRAVQSGSVTFLEQLKQRKFLSADSVILKMKGYQVTVEHMEMSGFNTPILVEDSAGLDLIVPKPSFTIKDVERYVGGEKVVDVIDVAKQSDLKMTMHEWAEYFSTEPRSIVLNVISLEFSDTGLSQLVSPPRIVLELSWVNNYWPVQAVDDPHRKPEVQKYCLMSTKDSYTDFHIDFGGTSVWYHVLWGEKVFYLIKPSASALVAFEAWSSAPNQSEVFFGDRVEHCYQLVLSRGQTLFIPTGWIHAVYTPADSLVFGGNFLHSLNVGLQFRVYELEHRLQLPPRFRFPNFETTCWYAARHIADTLKEHLEESKKPLPYLCRSAKELLMKLRSWIQPRDPTLAWVHKNAIPDGLQPGKVLRDLTAALGRLTQGAGPKQQGPQPKKKQPKTAMTNNSGGGKRDKLTVDLDVLEQHTHQALKESEESVSLKVKVPKKTGSGSRGASVPRSMAFDASYNSGDDDDEGLTIDDGSSSLDDSKPSALRLKLHLAEKQAGNAARSEHDKKTTGAGSRPEGVVAATAAHVSNQSSGAGRAGAGAAPLVGQGPALQSPGKIDSELQQPRRDGGSSRRQTVTEAAVARAYTRDDYVYPSLADSDGEDADRGFTKVKSRSGKKRSNQDDAWYPSTKVKSVTKSSTEQSQPSPAAPAAAQARPVRSSASATQNRGGHVRWPGAGSEDESGGSEPSSDEEGDEHATRSGNTSASTTASAASTHFAGKMVHDLSGSHRAQPAHSARLLMAATASAPARKFKKGMATTKQRLSKKLKLGQVA